MEPGFVSGGGGDKKKDSSSASSHCPPLPNKGAASRPVKEKTQLPDPPISYNQTGVKLKTEVRFNSTKRDEE